MCLDTGFKDENDNSYLMSAAQHCDYDIFSRMIDMELFDNVNDVNKDGDSALLIVANSESNYDAENQTDCDN